LIHNFPHAYAMGMEANLFIKTLRAVGKEIDMLTDQLFE
jgi:hypothetical protein